MKLELTLVRWFTAWGTFCARHPYIVIVLSTAVALGLAVGIGWLQVMFDAVELWNSPSSQTRKEKEYFDSTFRPFYRPAQVIVHATGLEGFKRNLSGIEYEFGPVFNYDFLIKMLELQQEIQKLTTPENNLTLADVSNKPLQPWNNASNIQNIWAYWQDEPANMGDEEEYLEFFITCSR